MWTVDAERGRKADRLSIDPSGTVPTEKMRIIAVIFMLCAAGYVSAHELVLEKSDETYTIRATGVPLSALLQRIETIEAVTIQHFGDDDRLITASFRNVTLDEMLARLRVSYALVYEADDVGVYRLGEAILLGHGEAHIPAETREQVLRLIQDLRDDDVRWNAHRALWALLEMECDIIPLLEVALHMNDYQGRHLVGHILRLMHCSDYVPSDKLLEVTLQLLGRDQYDSEQYWSLFGPTDAFEYLYRSNEDVYERIRQPLIRNLSSADPQERFLSAALLAERGEGDLAPSLVRVLAPHLADNDIRTDGGVAAHALFQLGPSAIPYLAPYRRSSDRQQAELADLIYRALESGEIPQFVPEMYAGRNVNPLRNRTRPQATFWRLERFPDTLGRHSNLREPRMTSRDHYGPAYNLEVADLPSHPSERISSINYSAANPLSHLDPFQYRVRPGDTVEVVSRDFLVSEKALWRLNPDMKLNSDGEIETGSIILIPAELDYSE